MNPETVEIVHRMLARSAHPGDETPPAVALAVKGLQLEVVVAGLPSQVVLRRDELLRGYVPLMRILIEAHRSAGRRIVAGLAGVPGSGKSTLAAVLAGMWRHVGPGPALAVVGMDGWHLTNAELDQRTIVADDGSTTPLRRRKGSPPSFDAAALASALRRIRHASGNVCVPLYDRNLHEPVPNAGVIPGGTDIVLIEGNYLLLDEGAWTDVLGQIDLPLWLEIDPEACRDGLLARHIAGGMPPDQAAAKVRENDEPNARIALSTRHQAAWVIHSDGSHALTDVRRG